MLTIQVLTDNGLVPVDLEPAGVHGWLLFWFVVLVSICALSLAALCLIGLGAAVRKIRRR